MEICHAGRADNAPAEERHMANCDCGTCCNECGHDSNCTSQSTQPDDQASDYHY
jgi:hypothetical protein